MVFQVSFAINIFTIVFFSLLYINLLTFASVLPRSVLIMEQILTIIFAVAITTPNEASLICPFLHARDQN